MFVPHDMGDVVCISISFDVGMDTCGDFKTAQLAHFVEHLCATFTDDEQRALKLASVHHNAWTDDKVTCYYAVGFVDAVVQLWLPLIRRGVTAPVLSDRTLRVEANAACTELKLAMQVPTRQLDECVARVETPYSGWSDTAAQVEFLEGVARAPAKQTRATVRRFIARHYHRRAHTMAVGHVRHRETIGAAVAAVGHAPMRIAAHDATTSSRFGYGARHDVVASGTTAHVEVRLALRDTNAARFAMVSTCAASILQNALFHALRTGMGAVYGVTVGALRYACNRTERASGRYRAWMCVRTSCDAERVDEVVEAVLRVARGYHADAQQIAGWRRAEHVSSHAAPASIAELMMEWVRASAEQRAIETPPQHLLAVERMVDGDVHALFASMRSDVEAGRYVVYCALPPRRRPEMD